MTGERYEPFTVRFTPEEHALLEVLGGALAPAGARPLSKADVIRIAVRRLAEAESVPLPSPPGGGGKHGTPAGKAAPKRGKSTRK
jgi:hypothetical protein